MKNGVRKNLVLLAIMALVVSLAVGCARGGVDAPTPADGAETGSSYPLTVKDDMGRDVTIAAEPKKVITIAPSATEILYAIGAGDRIVATDDYSDYPEEAQNLPKVGGLEVDLEKITELDPDMVISLNNPETVQAIEKLGFTVYVKDPQTFESVATTMRTFGKIFNVQEQANKAADDLQARIDEVHSKVADIPEADRLKVFYEVWNDPLMTAGPGSFISDMIQLAGGINIGDAAEQAWPTFSLETVVAENPDVIITTFPETRDALVEGERDTWNSIKAVQNDRILLLDQDIVSRPSPRLVDALRQTAEFLYPEKFE